MMGRYHNTFAGRPFFEFSSELQSSSSFTLYRDAPHLGHLDISSNSCMYNIQSFGQAWIFWYSIPIGHNIFLAWYQLLGNMFSSRSRLCTTWSSELKLFSLHPYLAPRIQRLLWITLQSFIHRGMCLLKRLLAKVTNHILQAISHFYIKRFRLGPTLHVCQFTMPYPCRVILFNPITQ